MAEVEYKGIKVGGSKLLLIIPLCGTIIGGLWGGFEAYQRYLSMEQKIANFVSPDLSHIDNHMNMVEAELGIISAEFNALKEVEEKIAEIQQSIANGTESDPVTIWVKHSDIVRAMPDVKENAIKGRLKRLREEKKVHWEAGNGYQSKKYDEII